MTLGRLALQADGRDEESLATQRRKLALLAVLVASGRRISRDRLVEMFWGDQDDDKARHSLSNGLSHLRRVIGRNAILPHRDEVGIEPGAVEWDATLFEHAVASERWAEALGWWHGPFLDGVYVDGSASFEHWVDGERARLEPMLLRALEGRTRELAAGDPEVRASVARRWLDLAPLSVPAATALLDSLAAPRTRDGDQRALAAYERLVVRLKDEFGRRPDREVVARARAIVDRLAAGDSTGEFRVPTELLVADDGVRPVGDSIHAPRRGEPELPIAAVPPGLESAAVDPGADGANASRPRPTPWRRWGIGVATAAVVALGALLISRWTRPRFEPVPGVLQTIAVGAVRTAGDSATSWLVDGIPQMLVARLARSEDVGLISLPRLRDYLPAREPGLDDLLAAARRLGATWTVSGGITRSDRGFVMDINVHDVASGNLVTVSTVAADDPVALADLAASRVLEAAGASGEGLKLADVETANPVAYQAFVRAQQRAWSDGPVDAVPDLDIAIAADSGFVSALVERATVALNRGEFAVLPSLLGAFEKHAARATAWDRAYLEAQSTFFAGDHATAETLARELVRRYPDDPRAVAWFVQVFSHHGKWLEADSLLQAREAAIQGDEVPARGICAACGVLASRFDVLAAVADTTAMELVARRLVALRPAAALGWIDLATALAYAQHPDDAIAAGRKAAELDLIGAASAFGRILVAAGRWAEAESLLVTLARQAVPSLQPIRLDITATLARERGRWRVAIRALDSIEAMGVTGLRLVTGDSYARIGDLTRARRHFDTEVPDERELARTDGLRGASRARDAARAFAWHRAIEGDAFAAKGDTVRAAMLVDSVARIGGLSYYARDWRLHHHLRGRLAAARGDHREAVRQFEAAWHGPAGWTRTDLALARSLRALGRDQDALGVLRRARLNNLDAMGRYVTRTEVLLATAVTFRALRQADSAEAYFSMVESAYRGADPEALAELAAARR